MPVLPPARLPPRQLPTADEVFLDHVGIFVDDAAAASGALARAGFAPTPPSVQVNPDPAGGAAQPTGTGNVCAMLARGYLEILFKTADTPLGRELDAGLSRYKGLHLAAFAVSDADAHHARLAERGFEMQPLVRMQRPVETATGPGIAGFEVVRLAPGQMPEGRIQMLHHRTEDTVWQPRWLDHPNSAVALLEVTIVVADVADAEQRYTRFLGRPSSPPDVQHDGERRILLDRGAVCLATRDSWLLSTPPLPPPTVPCMARCVIGVRSLAMAEQALAAGALDVSRRGGALTVPFPPELGTGLMVFVEVDADP